MSESPNKYAKDGKRVRNDIFKSIFYLIPLDTQRTLHVFGNYKLVPDQTKYKKKTFVLPKTFPEIATSLPEGTATASIKNFINAMKITKEEINSYKVKSDALEWLELSIRVKDWNDSNIKLVR